MEEEKTVKPKFAPKPKSEDVEAIEEVETKQVDNESSLLPEEQGIEEDLFRLTNDSYIQDPFFHEVADYFNIERKEYGEAAPMLKEIIEYVTKSQHCKTEEDVLISISKLERKVQPTVYGEERYRNVYRWARLANEKGRIEKKMKAFEK